MEIELKYLVDDREIARQIFEDEEILKLKNEGSDNLIPMHAIYFDTKDEALAENLMAMRIRLEGKVYVATLKWSGGSENGLHKREEINVKVSYEKLIRNPEIDIFSRWGIFDELKAVTKGQKLVPIMEMRFNRREFRLDTGKSVSILSYDLGEIRAKGRTTPVSEVELELFHGDEKDFRELGRKISAKYLLKPEDLSKFQRGRLL